jgi:hypothetical protein
MAGDAVRNSDRLTFIKRCPPLIVFLSIFVFHSSEIRAQESAGEADVAMQGYYLGGSGQSLVQTSGMAINSSQFIQGLGLISVNLEGYGGDGFHTGNVYAGIEGTPLFGWHWDFMGGDFHFSSDLVEAPFSNTYTPEIAGRGLRIAMKRTNRTYQFFAGEDSVLEGPRIPFRLILPQRVMGAAMTQKVGDRWSFGVRYLNTATSANALTEYPTYFSPGHEFQGSNSVTFQTTYNFSDSLKFYAETGYGEVSSFTPSGVRQQPFSLLIGPVWKTSKFTVQANYVRQSTSYMPLLGYFAGDRKGPYAAAQYRLAKWAEVYGSASDYANNLENNPAVASFRSSGYSFGGSLTLPWKFNADASYSFLRLLESDPTLPPVAPSKNSQISVDISRPIKKHSLRFSLMDMNLNANSLPQIEHLAEVDDTFAWKHLALGGAVRYQNTQTTDTVNTVYVRGSIQANFKRLSFYAYLEKGNDLVNQSVFSTSSVNTSVVGVDAPLFRGWTLQLEGLRNQLNTALNPENIFLFSNSDQGLTSQLSAFNQSSLYFKVGKHFQWGKPLDQGSTMEQYAAVHAPLVGSVEGLVMEAALSGPVPATNVSVILDNDRKVVTDANGHYTFSDVPEGSHEVDLNMDELPADYAPGPTPTARVTVQPRAIARNDFSVLRLASLSGTVTVLKDVPIDSVVIRIVDTKLYTTPYEDGTFSFYDLPEGKYTVEIDATTIPDGYQVVSPAQVPVVATSATPSPPITFELKVKPPAEKKVREMLNQEIHVTTPTGKQPGGKQKEHQ